MTVDKSKVSAILFEKRQDGTIFAREFPGQIAIDDAIWPDVDPELVQRTGEFVRFNTANGRGSYFIAESDPGLRCTYAVRMASYIEADQ